MFIPLFFQNTGKSSPMRSLCLCVPTSAFVPADQFLLNFEPFAAGGHTSMNVADMRTCEAGASGT